ncbi:MAG: hypothetical protein ACXAB5_06170 [Candidatus Thorarchaeota archaeon]
MSAYAATKEKAMRNVVLFVSPVAVTCFPRQYTDSAMTLADY